MVATLLNLISLWVIGSLPNIFRHEETRFTISTSKQESTEFAILQDITSAQDVSLNQFLQFIEEGGNGIIFNGNHLLHSTKGSSLINSAAKECSRNIPFCNNDEFSVNTQTISTTHCTQFIRQYSQSACTESVVVSVGNGNILIVGSNGESGDDSYLWNEIINPFITKYSNLGQSNLFFLLLLPNFLSIF